MDKSEYQNLPFYAWQCISLQTADRTIDLVIKDEKQMAIFLQFMIWSLKTVDGKSGSAEPFLDLMQKKQLRKIQKELHLAPNRISQNQKDEV